MATKLFIIHTPTSDKAILRNETCFVLNNDLCLAHFCQVLDTLPVTHFNNKVTHIIINGKYQQVCIKLWLLGFTLCGQLAASWRLPNHKTKPTTAHSADTKILLVHTYVCMYVKY